MKVLDWQLEELSSFKTNIHFIGGYKYDEIVKKYPQLKPSTPQPLALHRPGAGWTNKQPNCECGC